MEILIHRGAHEIGGNCVEISTSCSTIILDIGLPLNFNSDDSIHDALPQPLFENLTEGKKHVDAIFLSHPHLDHYGLIGSLPNNIIIFCGSSAEQLIQITALINQSVRLTSKLQTFKPFEPINIGQFTITPYLMDHSAFDSYAFLIETDKKNIFYTGDFRGHGRKGKLFDRLLENPPHVDILITEGTTIGPRSEEAFLSESELEDKFVDVINETKGTVFVTAAGQNIDRLVTIYKATMRSNRKMAVDPYIGEVLDSLNDHPRLPKTSWPKIRVAFSGSVARIFEKGGRKDILDKHRKNGVRWATINERPNEFVVLIRPSAMAHIKKYLDIRNSTWIYSIWQGYLERSQSLIGLKNYFEKFEVRFEMLHTSGHAKLSDLKKLVESLKPETIIPIHSFHTEKFKDYFPNVRLVKDGERIEV